MRVFSQTPKGVLLHCRVKTEQNKFSISDKGPYIEVKVKAKPLQGAANKEIMKEMSKFFDKPIMIRMGLTTQDKLILIQDSKLADVKKKIGIRSI